MFVARPHDAFAPVESTGQTHHGLAQHEPASADLVMLDSTRLLKGQREIRIRHGNEVYRLRHTRNDKLILTK